MVTVTALSHGLDYAQGLVALLRLLDGDRRFMSTDLSFPEREANALGDLDGVEDNADKYSPPNEPPSFACACRPAPGREPVI